MAEGEASRIPAGWRHWVQYGLLRTFALVVRVLSVRQCALMGAALGSRAFRWMGQRRRIVVNNLRIVSGGNESYARCEATGREVFRRTGANFAGGFRFGLLSPEEPGDYIEIRGIENVRAVSKSGRGIIVLLAHMGPWEVLAQVGERIFPGLPRGSFYRPIDNPLVDRFVRAEREKRGTRLFSRTEGLAEPVALLRAGGALAIVADQRAGKSGVWAPFFGRNASTTRLPSILHRKTGASLIAISVRTAQPGRWIIEVHPPVFPDKENLGSREAFIRRCNEMLEKSLRTSVEDGFWFHRRWRAERRPFIPGIVQGGNRVQRRVLAVLPDPSREAVACARGIAAFLKDRPEVRFVLAGPSAIEVARDAGLPHDFEHAAIVPAGAGKHEICVSFDAADRLGPAGIDGALVFTRTNVAAWARALQDAGLKTVLGPRGDPRHPGIRSGFVRPDPADDPKAYKAILEQMDGGRGE